MDTGSKVVIALLVITAGSAAVAADGQYTLSMTDAIDTPTRTVTVEGTQFTVSAIGQVQPDSQISFGVDAPSGTDYSVYLYNADREIVDTDRMTGSGTGSFPTDGLEPGSYMLVVNGPDGKYRAVHPVVIAGYEVQLTVPSGTQAGDSVTFSVELSQIDGTSEAANWVEVVVSKDGEDRHLTATKESAGRYTVTTTLQEAGTYHVYANVRGTEQVEGRDEVLGASYSQQLSVSEQTPTPTATPATEGSSSQQSTQTATPTATSTETATATPTATEEPTVSPTDSSTPSPTDRTTATPSPTATPSSKQNVITPDAAGTDAGQTSTTGSLGFGVGVAAFCLAVLLLGRTRQS